MCGRYVLKATLEELERKYGAVQEGTFTFSPKYNVAPSAQMPVVLSHEGRRVINLFRWGLVPFWADSINTGYSMINARCETLAKKKSFSKPFRSQRCVVPASGFYEWKNTSSGKIPHYITQKASSLINLAGLYETWKSDSGDVVNSYTIITTPANKPIQNLHDRMPAMLADSELRIWLNPENQSEDMLQDLLHPWPDNDITYHRVDTRVNNARNTGEGLIEPYQDLFS
ncbi:SOS response-associated peptidase [Rhodohalobacter mucosus]|uniref:Abasic site processing protein n=1 Tax=Rhodohalobacter mucosus TaxID=2079485 RepID=A0A316TS81_9BACT|nr:SOS response-associated peptidase [Rhodohalobacter mucosus]PWN06179.1 hypothetical protein DDZ15_10075 [Rhodohalobacter mucosus]